MQISVVLLGVDNMSLTSVLMSLILGVTSFFSGVGSLAYFIINDVTLIEPLDESVYSEESIEKDVPTISNETLPENSVETEFLNVDEVFNNSSYGVLNDCISDGKSVDEILSVFGLTEELAKEAMTCDLEYTSTNELYDRAALLYSKSTGLNEANVLKGYAEDEILKAEFSNGGNYRTSLEHHFKDVHNKALTYNHPGHLSILSEQYGDWVGSLIYLEPSDYYFGLVYEDYAELALFLEKEYVSGL